MPTSNFSTDILIVGAGPGGATTSLFLAKMGIPHCIVDAAVFPHPQTKVTSINVDTAGREFLLSGQEGICVQWR